MQQERYDSAVDKATHHVRIATELHEGYTLAERTPSSPQPLTEEFHREATLASTWALIAAAVKP